jgi:thymidylate synthase
MHVYEGDSADEVWRKAAATFSGGRPQASQPSRDGDTAEILRAIFTIRQPHQRWVVTRRPAMNPAFAIAEVVWMLRGRQDSSFLNYWNPKLPRFSGIGPKYDGAYGYRLRYQFGKDQIERAYSALLSAPDSRQVVLQIWDPRSDLPDVSGAPASADVPCNVCSLLKVRSGKLEWTQILRSNDLFLGVPYNFVQFTSLQEILAGWLELEPGDYVQFSDSLHVYDRDAARLLQCRSHRALQNNDTIALPKRESDSAFAELEADMLVLMKESLTQVELERVIRRVRPVSFRNFICVLGAYASRRRGWTGAVRELLTECTNPVFQDLCSTWSQTSALASA